MRVAMLEYTAGFCGILVGIEFVFDALSRWYPSLQLGFSATGTFSVAYYDCHVLGFGQKLWVALRCDRGGSYQLFRPI